MKKRLISICLAFVLVFTFGLTAYAQGEGVCLPPVFPWPTGRNASVHYYTELPQIIPCDSMQDL